MKHIKSHVEQEIKYRAVHSIVKCILFKIVRDIPCKGGHDAPASHHFLKEFDDDELETKYDAG
jgi:hypothetical protein